MKRQIRLLGWLTLILPVALYFWLLHLYAVNVPYWDDWDQTQMVLAAKEGTLRFLGIWHQVGENRMLFPNLLFLADAYLHHYDIKTLIYLSALCLVAACALVCWAFARRSGRSSPWSLAPFALLLFSLSQHEGALWATYLSGYMAVAFSVGAVVLLSEAPSGVGIAGAIACTIIASYSSMPGLFVWVAAIPALLLVSRPRWHFWVWGAAGAATTAVFLRGFSLSGAGGPPPSYLLAHSWLAVRGVFVELGNPLLVNPSSGGPGPFVLVGLFGAFSLAACGYLLFLLWRKDAASAAVPSSLALLGVIFAATVTAGRINGGTAAMTTSRYTIYSILLLVASWWSLSSIWRPGDTREWAIFGGGILAAMLVLQVGASLSLGIPAMKATAIWRTHCAVLLTGYRHETAKAFQGVIWWNGAQVADDAPLLAKYHMTTFG